MDDEVHAAVRSAVRALLRRHPGGGPALWTRLCGQIGAAGFAIPERYGGAGATLRETYVVLEELGRALTPAPLLASAVLAAQVLLEYADPAARTRLLPGIAAGTSIGTLVWPGAVAVDAGRLSGRADH